MREDGQRRAKHKTSPSKTKSAKQAENNGMQQEFLSIFITALNVNKFKIINGQLKDWKRKNKIQLYAVSKRFTLCLRTMNDKFPDIRNFIYEKFVTKKRLQTGIPTISPLLFNRVDVVARAVSQEKEIKSTTYWKRSKIISVHNVR